MECSLKGPSNNFLYHKNASIILMCLFNFRRWNNLCKLCQTLATYNRRQNKLRHFVLNWPFLRFTDFKMGKYSFSSTSPPCNVVPLFDRATYRKQQTLQLWMEGARVGVDSVVLWSCPIWVQYLNNFYYYCFSQTAKSFFHTHFYVAFRYLHKHSLL